MDAVDSEISNSTDGGERIVESCTHGTSSACMPRNEDLDTSKTNSEWKNRKGPPIEKYKEELINQGKCLCGHYIRARLRRAGALNRKIIQRLRVILEPSSRLVYEVFPALNSMGEEIERLHPRLYINVSRQLSSAPFGELQDGEAAPMLLNLVAKELFKTNITWGKIVSLFSVCGGFAIDCVRQGHYDYLQYLIDGMSEIIEDDLAHWLIDNGGWLGLLKHIRPPEKKYSFLGWLTMFVIISSAIYLITNVIKHIGCHLYSSIFS